MESEAEHEQLIATPNAGSGSYGVECWSVKTDTDADADLVNLNNGTPQNHQLPGFADGAQHAAIQYARATNGNHVLLGRRDLGRIQNGGAIPTIACLGLPATQADLSAYIGKSITLKFTGTEDAEH